MPPYPSLPAGATEPDSMSRGSMEPTRRLADLRRAGLLRRLRSVSTSQGPRVMLDGEVVLTLCSNNYLGLADHPKVRRAAAKAASSHGAGSGASRLISGNMDCHLELESELAEFSLVEASLLFGSGYLANTGTIAAVAGIAPGGVIFSDELNHASIIDGCRLADAETFVYRHADLDHLSWGLQKAGDRARLIVTDGLFSMDGNLAPLPGIVDLAERHGVLTMVDEAHATGCFGPEGRGAVVDSGMSGRVDLVVGTLGKAFGSYGAFVGCSNEMRQLLINQARTFVFSTAPPPPAIAAASKALDLVRSKPGRLERLQHNAELLRDSLRGLGIPTGNSTTHIIPVMVGDPSMATALSDRLLTDGIYAQAIRPPTVPDGTSRLRMSVMSEHEPADLRAAAKAVARYAAELGVEFGQPGAGTGAVEPARLARAA